MPEPLTMPNLLKVLLENRNAGRLTKKNYSQIIKNEKKLVAFYLLVFARGLSNQTRV